MNDLALSPTEAAFIAGNAYFALKGWEERYRFNMSGSTGTAPAVSRGVAGKAVVERNAVGAGPRSISQLGVSGACVEQTLVGSSGSNLIGRTRTGFGYVMHFDRNGKRHMVVATRGTRPEIGYPDLLTDVNMSTARHMPGIGPVHSGFYDTYKSLQPMLSDLHGAFLEADCVHCVGHSLGGAVANLVAIYLAKAGAKVKLYTFGAPRVGLKSASYDKKMNALIGEDNMFRVSHNLDPIPMIPIAPFIHLHPNMRDKNNFFIGSPVKNISMDNHDTNNYIASVENMEWDGVRSNKLQEIELDKQYFRSWANGDDWLKKMIGISGQKGIAILSRILRGMLDAAGVIATEIVTIFDLLALAIRSGIDYVSSMWAKAKAFLEECARYVGIKAKLTREALQQLMDRFVRELRIAAKLAIKTAERVVKSREFEVFLKVSTAGGIGLMFI